MTYLIWGTGTDAEIFLNEQWQYFFIKNSILAFIDNNKEKVGKKFFNIQIISPSMIHDFQFDRIFICSSYINEIKMQLKDELNIDISVIVSKEDIYKELYYILKNNMLISQQKILLLGDKEYYKKYQTSYSELYNIIGFVDFQDLDNILNYQYDYILLMDLMNILYLNRNIGKMNLEKYWINKISKTYNINNNVILTNSVNKLLLSLDRKECWGNQYPNKTFLVIRIRPLSGLGAAINTIAINIAYALQNDYIPIIDMMSYSNQYLKESEIGKINAWEKFFEQPTRYKLQDINKAKNILISAIYRKDFDCDSSHLLDFLVEKPALKTKIESYNNSVFKDGKRILGVLFRGSDYANRAPYGHPIQPDLDMMIAKVKEKLSEWGEFDLIYLASEVEEAVEQFQEIFKERFVCYPQKRVYANYNKYLSESNSYKEDDTYHRGADYWVVLNALAKCDSLIAGMCCGTDIALKLNQDQYQHTYIFNLGKYGLIES